MNTFYRDNIGFLKTGTEALNTALFYNFSNALLKFPVSLIQLSRFDQQGNMWFELKKPYKEISGMDKSFPGRLHFYKKNFTYYITIDGVATITTEENPDTVTIKFKISSAEYFYRYAPTSSLLIALKNYAGNFLRSLSRDDPQHMRLAI